MWSVVLGGCDLLTCPCIRSSFYASFLTSLSTEGLLFVNLFVWHPKKSLTKYFARVDFLSRPKCNVFYYYIIFGVLFVRKNAIISYRRSESFEDYD